MSPGNGRTGRRRRGPAGWLGGAAAALLAAGLAVAAVGPARADTGPLTGVRLRLATPAPQVSVQTISAQYSCDFSGYGSGISAAALSAEYAVPDSWPVSNPANIGLGTGTLSLPSQVSSQLTGVDSFDVQATVQAQSATSGTFSITGDSTDTLPNPPTQVPQITSFGQVTFPNQGTGKVMLPPVTIVITPLAGTTAKPPITCTTTTAAQAVSITVGPATGSFYQCTLTVGSLTATVSGFENMTFTTSGSQTVGATDTVTLTSTDLAGLLTGLPSGATEDFSGSMPVQGAQSGNVSLTGSITTPASGPLTATGTLSLSSAGTISLLLPQTFTITVSVQGSSVQLSCTLQTSPAPTALTLSVSSPTTEGTGTPAGGPATGGGLGLASGKAPVAAGAGAALMAVGGMLLLWARRARRRRSS